jgi:cytochrome c heme-lyase
MWPFGEKGPDPAPVITTNSRDDTSIDSCPVDEGTRKAWLARSSSSSSPSATNSDTTASSSASSAYAFLSAKPESHNTITSDGSGLSKDRIISSIPRWFNGGKAPEGDEIATSPNWVYPSPNQFFSAMSRKNHNPRAEDMNVVVPIHNAVNERAWNGILEWEKAVDEESWKTCGGPKLVSFKGRPKDVTWKAWSRSLLG